MTIQNKLKIIATLFFPAIKDVNGNIIDYLTISGCTRAYYITRTDLINPYTITKSDMIYMNNIIKKLISILGTEPLELSLSNMSTLQDVLHTNDISSQWIKAYNNLIQFIKETNGHSN